MPEVSQEIVVPVPPEEAWDFAADVRNARRWVFGIREIEGQVRHPLLPGDRLQVRLMAGGRVADSVWRIGECQRPSVLRSEGQGLGASATLEITCAPHGSGGTLVGYRLRYRLPGGALGDLAARFGVHGVLELQAKRSVGSLRRLLVERAEARRAPLRAEQLGSG